MLRRTTILWTLPLILSGFASAANVLSTSRDNNAASSSPSMTIPFKNVADPFNFQRVDFMGDGQTIYVANITVDGNSYEARA